MNKSIYEIIDECDISKEWIYPIQNLLADFNLKDFTTKEVCFLYKYISENQNVLGMPEIYELSEIILNSPYSSGILEYLSYSYPHKNTIILIKDYILKYNNLCDIDVLKYLMNYEGNSVEIRNTAQENLNLIVQDISSFLGYLKQDSLSETYLKSSSLIKSLKVTNRGVEGKIFLGENYKWSTSISVIFEAGQRPTEKQLKIALELEQNYKNLLKDALKLSKGINSEFEDLNLYYQIIIKPDSSSVLYEMEIENDYDSDFFIIDKNGLRLDEE